MGDFRKRVGLIHELRELRGAEELTHGSHDRLRIDQIVRHDRIDIDSAHALLDRTLHAHETNAVVVFHQFTDRTDTAVAEVVDVVDFALAVLQVENDLHHTNDVLIAQHAHVVRRRLVVTHRNREAHVHLHAADGREVIALGIEEQLAEKGFCSFLCRRLARAHHAVDIGKCLETIFVLVRL